MDADTVMWNHNRHPFFCSGTPAAPFHLGRLHHPQADWTLYLNHLLNQLPELLLSQKRRTLPHLQRHVDQRDPECQEKHQLYSCRGVLEGDQAQNQEEKDFHSKHSI
ncbi:unnamed protein product [Lepidochelys kempii]